MGEYINHLQLGEIKIGTCENLYYTTYRQFEEAHTLGSLTGNEYTQPEDYLKPDTFRFRFPFPDENIEMGFYDDFDRGELIKVPKTLGVEIGHGKKFHRIENKAGALGFELPCIQSEEFPIHKFDWSNTKDFTIFEIVQQKPVKVGDRIELQTVVRCPYCDERCRLSSEEAQKVFDYMKAQPDQFTDLQKQIIEIMFESYRLPIYDYSKEGIK